MRKDRKRKGTRREPNGRYMRDSKEEREKDVKDVVITARERVYGLSKGSASLQEAGSAVGRLVLAGQLTRAQADAAEEYEKVVRAFLASIEARRPSSPGDLNRSGGYDGREGDDPAYIEKCHLAVRRYKEARRGLLEASPLAHFAMETWVTEGHEVWSLLGDLRLGLNALARLWRVDEWRKDEAA
jgi:hypothetical protein